MIPPHTPFFSWLFQRAAERLRADKSKVEKGFFICCNKVQLQDSKLVPFLNKKTVKTVQEEGRRKEEREIDK